MITLWQAIADDDPGCFEELGVKGNDYVYSENAMSGLQVQLRILFILLIYFANNVYPANLCANTIYPTDLCANTVYLTDL